MARARGRIDLNPPGIRELLKRSDVRKVVDYQGQELGRVAGQLSIEPGAEYRVQTWTGRDRVRTHVATHNPEAMKAEARERSLTRAAYILRGRG